jgi:hypothetical protein
MVPTYLPRHPSVAESDPSLVLPRTGQEHYDVQSSFSYPDSYHYGMSSNIPSGFDTMSEIQIPGCDESAFPILSAAFASEAIPPQPPLDPLMWPYDGLKL